jgi:hypothetical protein
MGEASIARQRRIKRRSNADGNGVFYAEHADSYITQIYKNCFLLSTSQQDQQHKTSVKYKRLKLGGGHEYDCSSD